MTTDPATRQAYIAGLRALARFLSANPEVPVPDYGTGVLLFADGSDEGKRRAVDRFAALTGARVTDSVHYTAVRAFGPVRYEAVAVPAAVSAAYRAHMTYDGCVTPDAAA